MAGKRGRIRENQRRKLHAVQIRLNHMEIKSNKTVRIKKLIIAILKTRKILKKNKSRVRQWFLK